MTTPLAVSVDPGRIAAIRRWSRGVLVGGLVFTGLLFVVAVVVAVLSTGGSRVVMAIMAVLFLLLGLAFVWVSRHRVAMNAVLTAGDATFRMDDRGIETPGLGLVAWQEIRFFSVLDAAAESELSVRGDAGARAGRAAGQKAGQSQVMLAVGVVDGEAWRRRVAEEFRKRIVVHKPWSDGMARGVTTLGIDGVFSQADTLTIVTRVRQEAAARGIPCPTFATTLSMNVGHLPYVDEAEAGRHAAS